MKRYIVCETSDEFSVSGSSEAHYDISRIEDEARASSGFYMPKTEVDFENQLAPRNGNFVFFCGGNFSDDDGVTDYSTDI